MFYNFIRKLLFKKKKLLFSAPTCKGLRSLHSHSGNENKLDKMKIGDFIKIHQRIEVTWQMPFQNLEKEVFPESIATKTCLPGAEVYGVTMLKKHGNSETETRVHENRTGLMLS